MRRPSSHGVVHISIRVGLTTTGWSRVEVVDEVSRGCPVPSSYVPVLTKWSPRFVSARLGGFATNGVFRFPATAATASHSSRCVTSLAWRCTHHLDRSPIADCAGLGAFIFTGHGMIAAAVFPNVI